jgi:hypothetical protein
MLRKICIHGTFTLIILEFTSLTIINLQQLSQVSRALPRASLNVDFNRLYAVTDKLNANNSYSNRATDRDLFLKQFDIVLTM